MKIVTLQEAAETLGIKENTMRVAALKEKIPATKSGKIWLIDLDDPAIIEYSHSHKPVQHKTHEAQTLRTCPICGKPLPRARSKYCSQECYGKAMEPAKED